MSEANQILKKAASILGEDPQQVAVTLERYFLEHLKVWTQYSYMNNRSNRGSFDYSRKVAGVGITAVYY